MSEKYTHEPNADDNLASLGVSPEASVQQTSRYDTGYDREPSWGQMDELFSVLDLSKDPTDRADEVVHHFTRGKDIEGFTQVVHQYAVPDTLTTELKFQSFSINTDGNPTNYFAMPEERPLIFTFAARQIQELAEKRIVGDMVGDQAYLDAVADIVALATIYAHSYNDGNGRTSRIAAEVIRSGASDDETMRMLATNQSVGVKGKNWLNKGYGESFRLGGYIPRDKQMSWATMFEALAMKDVPLSDIAEREARRNQLIEAPTSMGSADMVQY